MLTPNDVFTPASLPIGHTNVYASRGSKEKLFRTSLDRGMIPVVFGEYEVGKTSMARYELRKKDSEDLLVNIESVADKKISDIFARILEKLGYSVQTKKISATNELKAKEHSGQANVSTGWVSGLIGSKRTNTSGSSQSVEEVLSITSPTESRLIEVCEKAKIVLMLDELHQATPEFANDLAKFIKTYGNSNCKHFKIVLLGTSSDASRLVSSDPGIDRLLQEVHLKSMNDQESNYVVKKGFKDLAINIENSAVERLVRTCVGSPSILQYLSLEVAEASFAREPRVAKVEDVNESLASYVENKAARLLKLYLSAVETTGGTQYRKQILRAMAEAEEEYVTMDGLRTAVSKIVGRDIPSTALSGPLRTLKEQQYGAPLSDVQRPDNTQRLTNYTTFRDPALKAFIRLQVLREGEGDIEV